MKENKVGLIVGLFLGGWHAFWSLLIFIGLAQPLIDWIFWLHMITPVYHVTGFNATQAGLLILVTFGIGYLAGYLFAMLWNSLQKKRR